MSPLSDALILCLVNLWQYIPNPTWLRVGQEKDIDKDNRDQETYKQRQLAKLPPSRSISRLRWDLAGRKIDLGEAARLLNIQSGTRAENHFQHLINLSQDARHVYDADLETEYVAFLHPTRDFVAVYQTTPLFHDPELGYSVMRSAAFFMDHDLDHLLVRAYREKVAARRIKRSLAFKRWMERPVTHDGNLGIECRLAMQAIADLDQQHFPHRPAVQLPPLRHHSSESGHMFA